MSEIEGRTYFPKITKKAISKIDELIIPEGIKVIGDEACENGGFKKVVFPSTLKMIGRRAFAGCRNLQEIVLKPGIEGICHDAFYKCLKLKEVKMPDDGINIDERAFTIRTKLKY